MAKHGKNYIAAAKQVDRGEEIVLSQAIAKIQEMAKTKFTSSLEGHFKIGYKSMQNVRGVLQLPHGTGKKVRILVFAKGEKAEEAKAAGADFVGDADLIEKVSGGWTDFEFVVATPDLMKDVGKLGPILGRKGLMPKPKAGTVTNDIKAIIEQLRSGRIEYRADKTGVIHLALGKLDFSAEQLVENATAAFQTILKGKPSDAKGDYIVTFFLAGTMTPSVRIATRELR